MPLPCVSLEKWSYDCSAVASPAVRRATRPALYESQSGSRLRIFQFAVVSACARIELCGQELAHPRQQFGQAPAQLISVDRLRKESADAEFLCDLSDVVVDAATHDDNGNVLRPGGNPKPFEDLEAGP